MDHYFSFSLLDRRFAEFLTSLSGKGGAALHYACALLSRQVAEGHVCLDLRKFAGQRVISGDGPREVYDAPELKQWQDRLFETPVVGMPGEFKPLILDHRARLYLYRYWEYESILADRLRRLASQLPDANIRFPDRRCMDRLFPCALETTPDWRIIAALAACINPFLLICGSPGTGKTTTVAAILALLLELYPDTKPRIALTAPTGKAAARLQEAIRSAKQNLECDQSIKTHIPDNASTVHRLLEILPGSDQIRYNRKNLLPVDVMVVDEASMLDMPLLSKLLHALPETARLILLGDRDQLASVEAGAVLGDLCGMMPSHLFSKTFLDRVLPYAGSRLYDHVAVAERPGIYDCIVELRMNYRFSIHSGIGKAGNAVNRGEGSALLRDLMTSTNHDVFWSSLPKNHELEEGLKPIVKSGFKHYLDLIWTGTDWEDIFASFERFRILCALRQGPFGAVSINSRIERILESEHLIGPEKPYYIGRPIIILRNHPPLRLYNGDVGLILPDPDKNGDPSAVFQDGPGRYRRFALQRLPEHETVFAMTIHKSQGSEFQNVLIILPDQDGPVLTRELIYTGITRARREVRIWGNEGVFVSAVSRCVQRTSGLREALWESSLSISSS